MAQTCMKVTIELQILNDAIDDVRNIVRRLAKLHGSDHRKLDRDIQDVLSDPKSWIEMHWLGNGRALFAPGESLTEVLREARRLKVIK